MNKYIFFRDDFQEFDNKLILLAITNNSAF